MKKVFLIAISLILIGLAGGALIQETRLSTVRAAELPVISAVELPDPGLTPDRPFYFLKRFFENVGTFFTFRRVARAERALHLAEKRLAEANVLFEKGKSKLAEKTIECHQNQLRQALIKADQARKNGYNIDDILTRISEATLNHQSVLIDVYERVPEQAQSAIERAIENSMRGHEQAIRAVSEEKLEEVGQQMEQKRERVRERVEQMKQIEIPVEIPVPAPEPSVDLPSVEIPVNSSIRPLVPVLNEFPGKVVYTTDMDKDPASFQKDCNNRAGVFYFCGDICHPEAEMCPTVCAYTCEF